LLLLASLAGLAGCSQTQVRSQKEEETEKERYLVKTVGEVCTFGNAEPVPVSGVGLVEGLEGTGSPAPAGDMRQIVENELKRAKIPNIKQILASNDFSLVVVSTMIPPGAKKGDKLDLEITLPPGSRTTSLRGGYLRRCMLFNYDYTGRLNPAAESNTALRGHPVVRAEGPLLLHGSDPASETKARIWSGGICQLERQFHILLDSKHQFARVASNVASRVNASFQGTLSMTPGNELALARNNTVVVLNVAPQYKLNLPRYLRVIRMIPLEEIPAADNKPRRLPYREQLREDLLEPARTVTVALRLEALGNSSIPILKEGLKSPQALVRFCSAEALAYLGSPACGDELARVVRQQPYLRAFALTALASLDENVSNLRLKDLIEGNLDDETRYGAFRALRTLDEHDPLVHGELLNETFWLHQVARESPPLIHLSTTRRAEIVLFGSTPKLVPPCSLLAGEFAITAAAGDQRCTITHVPLHSGETGKRQGRFSLELPEILKVMASAGATYPEVIELIRQADSCKNLSCRVKFDALPQAVSVEEVAEAGRRDAIREKQAQPAEESVSEVLIIKPIGLGRTPTLYDNGTARQPAALDSDIRVLQQQRRERDQGQTAERE
jgi:hypothetical protein